MKIRGIVRRVDDLGRIVLPKDFRERLEIKEGQALEMAVIGGLIIMGKVELTEIDGKGEDK